MHTITVNSQAERAAGAMPAGCGTPRGQPLWSSLQDIIKLLNIPPITVDESDNNQPFLHLAFKHGHHIHSVGQPFDALYLVNAGFLKTVVSDEFGSEHILNFPMRGDLIGFDGVYRQSYTSEAVALSDCDLIYLPFYRLTALCRKHPELEALLYGAMSQELVRKQAMIATRSALTAEARVARFLLALGERYARNGYSSNLFNLRMTRSEIGSYLGLSLETVSRTLSALAVAGMIDVDQRTIRINNPDALTALRRLPPSASRHARPDCSGAGSKSAVPQPEQLHAVLLD